MSARTLALGAAECAGVPANSGGTANNFALSMGFTIMESFMDKVRVRSAEGKGTTVFLSRQIIRKNIVI